MPFDCGPGEGGGQGGWDFACPLPIAAIPGDTLTINLLTTNISVNIPLTAAYPQGTVFVGQVFDGHSTIIVYAGFRTETGYVKRI